MKDWKNIIISTLAGALVTFTIMFVSTTRIMATQDQLKSLATNSEVALISNNITEALQNHTRAIENLATEVGNLRQQVGRVEGAIKTMNNN
ncbi:hypothetical protein LCGC14_1757400 [marine sediment metagenome]|uniref:Uncharacterized protein n=1 Tax=marine sediment metagenome TaxID=412755 RepID=A0A0F9K1N1_9ZZZZ